MKKKVKIIITVATIFICIIGNWAYNQLGGVSLRELPVVIKTENKVKITNDKYKNYVEASDIVRDLTELGGVYPKYYDKCLQYIAPNGKPITIVAMDQVSDLQLIRAYNMLSFYLDDYNGASKSDIANQMADNYSVLVMPNGADGEGEIPNQALTGQTLFQMETPVTGDQWYVENDYEHRDAAFEEILHLVHDYGIGTQSNPGARPQLQKEIYAATMNALPTDKKEWGKVGLWGIGFDGWLSDIEKEGSLEQEYLASVVDSYYGLWVNYTESDGGMWGGYIAKSREEIIEKDPMGYKVLYSFLPEQLSQMEAIDSSFEGTFVMERDLEIPYTAKSQYLQNVRLTGAQDSNILGNDSDNIFMGNKGTNYIDGQGGLDVLQLKADSSKYIVDYKPNQDGYIQITDTTDEEGIIYLKNIEILRFTDKDIHLK